MLSVEASTAVGDGEAEPSSACVGSLSETVVCAWEEAVNVSVGTSRVSGSSMGSVGMGSSRSAGSLVLSGNGISSGSPTSLLEESSLGRISPLISGGIQKVVGDARMSHTEQNLDICGSIKIMKYQIVITVRQC